MKKLFVLAAACGVMAAFSSCADTKCDCTVSEPTFGMSIAMPTVDIKDTPYKSCKDFQKALEGDGDYEGATIKCK